MEETWGRIDENLNGTLDLNEFDNLWMELNSAIDAHLDDYDQGDDEENSLAQTEWFYFWEAQGEAMVICFILFCIVGIFYGLYKLCEWIYNGIRSLLTDDD